MLPIKKKTSKIFHLVSLPHNSNKWLHFIYKTRLQAQVAIVHFLGRLCLDYTTKDLRALKDQAESHYRAGGRRDSSERDFECATQIKTMGAPFHNETFRLTALQLHFNERARLQHRLCMRAVVQFRIPTRLKTLEESKAPNNMLTVWIYDLSNCPVRSLQ